MKTSTLLFVVLCVGTVLVQIFLNLGYRAPYEVHLSFLKNQNFPINSFPAENIKAVLAKGVRFTMYQTNKKQGFRQEVRALGISFTMQGGTLVIASKDGKYDEKNYFETYFFNIPVLILQNTNINIVAANAEMLQTNIAQNGMLLVQESSFKNIVATVADSSTLILNPDATVAQLNITLKDKAIFKDNGANIGRINPFIVSDNATITLSGHGFRAWQR